MVNRPEQLSVNEKFSDLTKYGLYKAGTVSKHYEL